MERVRSLREYSVDVIDDIGGRVCPFEGRVIVVVSGVTIRAQEDEDEEEDAERG